MILMHDRGVFVFTQCYIISVYCRSASYRPVPGQQQQDPRSSLNQMNQSWSPSANQYGTPPMAAEYSPRNMVRQLNKYI